MNECKRPELLFFPDENQKIFSAYCNDLDKYGVNYIWHNLAKANQSIGLVSNRAWAKRFAEGNCTQFDIVDHLMYDRRINFFRWADLFDCSTSQQVALMRERETDYRLFNGVTICLERRSRIDGKYVLNYRETLSLATHSPEFNLPEFCLENYQFLRGYLSKLTHLSTSLMKNASFPQINITPADQDDGFDEIVKVDHQIPYSLTH